MEERQRDLSVYRLQKAQDDLETAESNLIGNKLSQSINRSYYAMFHAARAMLALDKIDSKKHSGVISFFNRYYIKTGKIEREYSKILSEAFDIRNDSDYDDFYFASKEDAQNQLENAKRFLKRIREFIDAFLKKEGEGDEEIS
ncbi:MAG: HEPN domain-containing protein, partial [Candidatus Aminicenantes bacterium]|nr:HEPN domain-containing protein [Candidatus Aminicenantes bacterium]